MTWSTLMLAWLITPERLFADGEALAKAQELDAARAKFELCLERDPKSDACWNARHAVCITLAEQTNSMSALLCATEQRKKPNDPFRQPPFVDWPTQANQR
ncbi:MAG: hypothetical protein JNM17_35380 [Archangium sp.]|nr:hypothetical protein [Archangium sp.]